MTLKELLDKNEPKLKGLHPKVAEAARKLIEQAYQRGIFVLITQGYRSMEEQARLYAMGRTKPGKIVTNAKPGYSYHNYGLAIDFCLLRNGRAVWTVDDDWRTVAQLAKGLGFEWGGDWKGFKDYPHLQMTFGLSIKDLLAGKRPPAYTQAKKPAEVQVASKKEEEIVEKCSIVFNGKKLEGIIHEDRSYAPVRALAEALGLKVEWDARTKTVILKEGDAK